MRKKHIEAFSSLGKELNDFVENEANNPLAGNLRNKISSSFHENGWFSEENIKLSVKGISSWLNDVELEKWLSAYPESSSWKLRSS